ncbi:MAG: hypothetical protein JKX80_02165 [Candidatus Pacebacteria bacterium]|nr:hypothetical protein [Candidatus Paceibacterota bacterium]
MRILILFFLFVSTFVFVGILQPINTSKEIVLLSRALENFTVPNVSIGTVEYTVTQGNVKRTDGYTILPSQRVHVLKIAYASVVTRVNPLFSFSGANPQNLRASAQVFENSLKSLQGFYTPEEQNVLNDGFYPIALVRSIARAEETRNSLIQNPNSITFRAYIKSTGEAIATFGVYTTAVEKMYERALPNDLQWRYNFVGGKTTRVHVLDFTKQVHSEIQKLTQKFEERTGCIVRPTKECQKLSIEFKFPDNINATIRPHSIPEDVALNRKTLLEVYKGLPETYNDPATEPIFLLENPYCFPDKNYVFYTTVQELYADEILTKTFNVNNLYFFEADKSDSPYLQKVAEKGFTFFYQPPTNTYMCPLDMWDSARILTMRTIRNELKANPIFAEESLQKWRILKKKELAINDSDLVHSTDIDTYMYALRELLQKNNGDDILAKEIGEEKVYDIEHLLAIYQAQSAYISELLVLLPRENTFVARSLLSNVPINIEELTVTRSSPLLGLFTFNASIYSERPRFMTRNTSDFESLGLTKYNENTEFRTRVPREKLADTIRKVIQYERSLK